MYAWFMKRRVMAAEASLPAPRCTLLRSRSSSASCRLRPLLHEPANHFLCSANDSNSSKLRVGILQRWPDMGFRLLSLSPDSAADLSLLLFSACPKRLVRVHAVGSEVKRPCRSSNRKLGRMYRTWRFRDRIFDISPFLKYRLWYVFDASGKFCYEIIAKCWFWIL